MRYECHNEDGLYGVGEHIPAEQIDLVITKPPSQAQTDFDDEDAYFTWSEAWLMHAHRVLRYGGSCYLVGSKDLLDTLYHAALSAGFVYKQKFVLNESDGILLFYRNPMLFVRGLLKSQQAIRQLSGRAINEMLGSSGTGGGKWSYYTGNSARLPSREVWDKLQEIFSFSYPYDVMEIVYNPIYKTVDLRNLAAQDPIALPEALVKMGSREGDAVLDPFARTGDAGVAALRNGCTFYGFETDEALYSTMLQRLEAEDTAE